jgi:hyperosmotically inducible protein
MTGTIEMKKTSYLSAILIAVICTLTLGCASTRTQESSGEYLSDTWITTKIKTSLAKDSVVKATEVNVETFKGAVQLTGFVTSKAAMDQAVVIAKNVDGVTSVKNGMQIK